MAGPHKKPIAAVEAYFADLGCVRASGGATEERSCCPVLVTNLRDFVLVGADGGGGPVKLEAFGLAEDADDFRRKVETPRAFAHKVGRGLGEYQARALSHRAALAEPKDLAWLLACYARDGLARGQRLAALVDPEIPVSGVTRAPLRPAIATITVPTDAAGRNMTGDDFPMTAQAGVTSERLTPQRRARAASSNAPICRRNPPPWGTRCPHSARQPLIPT